MVRLQDKDRRMSDLGSLHPTKSRRIIDLVRQAGVDVTDWGNYAGGPARAATNPKYCYEWAFVQPGRVVVLNLWHRNIRERRGVITFQDNFRASAVRHARLRTASSKVRAKRAANFDEAVKTAAAQKVPVRVAICEGRMRKRTDPKARVSKVTARMLDPVPWAVTTYHSPTGEFTLTRGALPDRLVDQFAVDAVPKSPTETRSATGMVFMRNGAVRQAALARAAGQCEWCHKPGFTMSDGAVFLETHHVVPLGESGPDTVTNVVALCPNHHREAHYGAARDFMREGLLRIAQGAARRSRSVG